MPDASQKYAKPAKLVEKESDADRYKRLLLSVLVRLEMYLESVEGASMKDFLTREVVQFWREAKLDSMRGVSAQQNEDLKKERLERILSKFTPSDREFIKEEYLRKPRRPISNAVEETIEKEAPAP